MDTDSSADELVRLWQHDQDSLHFWRASSNFVYGFTQSGAKQYLRFSNDDDNTPADIIAELAFMQYLRGNRYSCVQPVPSLRGYLVETLDTQTGTYHAVVFSEAPEPTGWRSGTLPPLSSCCGARPWARCTDSPRLASLGSSSATHGKSNWGS